MTIKAHTAGSLTFTEIAAEWGGSKPHSLDEYHSGESLVYSGATGAPGGSTTTIPSSGTISFSNFYASERFIEAGSFTTVSATGTRNGGQDTSTVTVPSAANAIYVINTVAGGGGGIRGSDHKDVGESAGDGGGGGAAISAGYFTVTGGETLTLKVGRGGDNNVVFWPTGGAIAYVQTSNSANIDGGNTSIVGSSSGTLFNLGGGSGAIATRVGQFKLLRLDSPGSGGAVGSFSGNLSSGTTTGGASVGGVSSSAGSTGSDGAEVGENQSSNGGAGGNSGLGSGGGAGGTNNVKGSDGSLGGGGGGGHSQSTNNPAGGTSSDGDHGAVGASTHGGLGGHGQLQYKFVRVT